MHLRNFLNSFDEIPSLYIWTRVGDIFAYCMIFYNLLKHNKGILETELINTNTTYNK